MSHYFLCERAHDFYLIAIDGNSIGCGGLRSFYVDFNIHHISGMELILKRN